MEEMSNSASGVVRMDAEVGGRTLSLETGRMARQAGGAVYITYGGSALLVAATAGGRRDLGFFPLTIEYRERTYAAGKIPGGFFKREGRPQEKEVLSARLIDRPLRPLFAEGYMDDTQVYCLVLSSDDQNDPSLLGITGASAALMISDIPWDGPVSSVKMGRVDGELVVNPTVDQQAESDLDLIVAVKGGDVVMLEGSCEQLTEVELMEAVDIAAAEASRLNELQIELARVASKPKREHAPKERDPELRSALSDMLVPELDAAYGNGEKHALSDARSRTVERAVEELAGRFPGLVEEGTLERELKAAASDIEKEFVRHKILVERKRYDGRDFSEVREVSCEVGVLPRPHGSALFTRGETQALVAVTLGGARDEQRIDALLGEYTKDFMLHYNFPPFSVGEVKPARGPGRREIGHGHLAEVALSHVLPSPEKEFNYTIRVVSDVLESNGSSSQATICGGSLSLMDAGVPVSDAIAGVAMGLISDGSQHAILSDIAGVEDHLGDMDLKIAGSRRGVTAVQMDLKVEGIPRDLLREAMLQARDNRLTILDVMDATIAHPRQELSMYAPRIFTVQIDKDMIGKLIGPGGKNIRAITDETGVDVNVDDTGKVTVLSSDAEAAQKALELIELSTGKPKEGKVYDGVVVSIVKFGAFVEIMPGTDGLLHISQISKQRIGRVEDVLEKGQRVRVRVLSVKPDGKVDLTMKDVD